MKTIKFIRIAYIALVVSLNFLSNCRQSAPIIPDDNTKTNTAIRQYKAIEVKENGALVYKEGATDNIVSNYSKFSLRLETISETNKKVRLTEVTGEVFNGIFNFKNSLNEEILELRSLSPIPTNTNGNIEYTVMAKTENSLILKSLIKNSKTGNSINEYKLRLI